MSNYQSKPTGEIGKAMEYKQAGIEKSQRSTQDSIRVSGSATDATLMVTTFYTKIKELAEGPHDNESMEKILKEKWEMWRKYFFAERDINETFKKYSQPF